MDVVFRMCFVFSGKVCGPKYFCLSFAMVRGFKVLSSLFQGIMEVVTASSGSLAPNPRARR